MSPPISLKIFIFTKFSIHTRIRFFWIEADGFGPVVDERREGVAGVVHDLGSDVAEAGFEGEGLVQGNYGAVEGRAFALEVEGVADAFGFGVAGTAATPVENVGAPEDGAACGGG